MSIGVVLLQVLAGCAYHEKVEPPVAAKMNGSHAFFSADWPLKKKTALSNEMTAKLLEIISRKPMRLTKTIKAKPRGYFVVGGRVYAFHYGFIVSDPPKGGTWDDPVLHKFWERLTQEDGRIDKLKYFKP